MGEEQGPLIYFLIGKWRAGGWACLLHLPPVFVVVVVGVVVGGALRTKTSRACHNKFATTGCGNETH